jgi:hypothetical protein
MGFPAPACLAFPAGHRLHGPVLRLYFTSTVASSEIDSGSGVSYVNVLHTSNVPITITSPRSFL